VPSGSSSSRGYLYPSVVRLVGAGVVVRRLPIPRVTGHYCRPAGRSRTRSAAVDHRLTTGGPLSGWRAVIAPRQPRQSLLLRAGATTYATATVTRTRTAARTGTRTTITTTATTTTTTTTTTTSGICAGALRPRGEDSGLLRVNRHGAPSPRVRCIGRPGYGSSSFGVIPHRRPRAMCPPAGIATWVRLFAIVRPLPRRATMEMAGSRDRVTFL